MPNGKVSKSQTQFQTGFATKWTPYDQRTSAPAWFKAQITARTGDSNAKNIMKAAKCNEDSMPEVSRLIKRLTVSV